jgi:putative transposase
MVKAFRYRLYCTKVQQTLLSRWLGHCRWVYNKTLEIRKTAWDESETRIGLYGTNKLLTQWKLEKPELREVHSQVLQNAQFRVDRAFQGFFQRVKAKAEEPGFPRFRNRFRYDSLCWPQYPGGAVLEGSVLKIKGIGNLKLNLHRPVEGVIKTTTILSTSTGKWFVSFIATVEAKALEASTVAVGLDAGLENLLTTDQGEVVRNPRFLRTDEHDLKRAQRKLSAQPKGTTERSFRRKAVARVHERIRNRRLNFAHQISRRLVDRCGVIVFEKLNIQGMIKNHCLAKSISDAAWRLIRILTIYKAEEAGRIVVQVNPAYTSQDCSRCGTREKKSLDIRIHRCKVCGLELHRDHNAALNILRLGLQSLA